MQQLHDLRGAFPRCTVVALVDLSTEMSLAASTGAKLTQEKLDRLCCSAVELFAREPCPVALACAGGRVELFVRSQANEALCLQGDLAPQLPQIIHAARDFLAEISRDGGGSNGGAGV